MTASNEFIEFVMELLQPIPALEGKRLFGGYGVKSNHSQFAMIMNNTLYFVVSDLTRPKYEAQGKKPFFYGTKTGPVYVKRYYEVPEELLEDQEALLAWARESIAIAQKNPPKS